MVIGIIAAVLILVCGYFIRHVLGGMFGLYRIVPVNEAHIRIMNNKKEVFSSRTGKSAYWVVPFVTKLHKLPLSNLAIPTDNIKLNDINMAKFICDIMCFVNIDNIELAVERLSLTHVTTELGFDDDRLSSDFRTIMESIGRTVAAKQTILDIYMNRQALVDAITKEVSSVFPKWGITLVNLELKHIKDAEGSSIISDIERLRAAEIRRDADIKVATTERESKIAQAEAQEAYKKREIQKDQAIEIARQDALLLTQRKTAEANIQAVDAKRKLEVGQAEINAMAAKIKVEQEAEAQKIKFTTESEGQAKQIIAVGQATADMIKAKLMAEAEGQLKIAEAMKAVNDSAMGVKALDNQKEIQIAKFKALAESLAKAEIKLIMSGEKSGSLFGMDFNAETGANLGQFLGQAGVDRDGIVDLVKSIKN